MRELFERITGVNPEAPIAKGNASTTAFFEDPEPAIAFTQKRFSFTGKFVAGTRAWCVERTEALGGLFDDKPNGGTNFLVIGALSSRDWAHSSFGRKIEAAMRWRPGLKIVSEKHWCSHLPPAP